MSARKKSAYDVIGLFRLLGVVNKLSAENSIPELARDSKTKLVVEEMVSKVVLLELLVPQR
jgi:hypothetical protein